MRKILFGFTCLIILNINAQQINYEISFDKAVHHVADISVEFSEINSGTLDLRLSRTSPGRYALHEFAKNVYDVKAVDSNGEPLKVTRVSPYEWNVNGHDGYVKISYQLFADRGDGTYSQVDETHAHLNIPATFMYSPSYENTPIQLKVSPREDLNWKVATQLKEERNNIFSAPDLQYFMDSPIEISDYKLREFTVESEGKSYNIRFILTGEATEAEMDQYFDYIKRVVEEEHAVFGELPDFDYGTYTFLATYAPNASGDGMEHRNSTILTSTRTLSNGGIDRNIGTVSHEFFHAWNVERIRPKSLEPFDFQNANMSGELWFAEGFTSYYTNLILCRAGIITQEDYISGLSGALNYVWNSTARQYKNPIEMSYMAPFVDAARSVDPVNRENTFISYYSYGSVLGLALDLSLRELNDDLSMDGYMKLAWERYGKNEKPYTVEDMKNLLTEYAGQEFGETFYSEYIYQSKMPDYERLMKNVGVLFERGDETTADFGARAWSDQNGNFSLGMLPSEGSAAYKAALTRGDVIQSIDGKSLKNVEDFGAFITENFKSGETVQVKYQRYGKSRETSLTFDQSQQISTRIDGGADKKTVKRRTKWLEQKSEK